MTSSKYSTAVAGVLGLFFVASGIGKAMDTQAFADTIAEYGFSSLRWAAPAVIAGEIGLGVAFFLQVQLRRIALAGFMLLSVFTLLFAYGYLWHGVTSCGCFGAIEFLQVPPLVSFARNVALLALAGWLYYISPRQKDARVPALRLTLVVSTFVGSLILSTYPFFQPQATGGTKLALGQSVKNTALAPFRTGASDSSAYAVFIFSPTCPHCWAATPMVLRYQSSGVVSQIIALSPPSASEEKNKYMQRFTPPFRIQTVSSAVLHKMTDQVPTFILVERDTIRALLNARIPSPDSLQAILKIKKNKRGYLLSATKF